MRAQLGMAKRNSTKKTGGQENDSSKPARARAADETTRSSRGVSAGRSGGIVRYQVTGGESHGDSPARVSWFIDQLKK